jgi:spore coat protein CotH
MKKSLLLVSLLFPLSTAIAQDDPQAKKRQGDDRPAQPEGRGGPGGFPGGPGGGFPGGGFPGGPGGFGPPGQREVKLLEKFDADDNGWLSREERDAARAFLNSDEGKAMRPMRGFGPRGGGGNFNRRNQAAGGSNEGGPNGGPNGDRPRDGQPENRDGGNREGRPEGGRGQVGPGFGGSGGGGRGFGPMQRQMEPAKPGPKVDVSDVKASDTSLYDANTLRTIFLTFEESDWEKALEDFHDTDVDVAATMNVDGKEYPGVGIRFRGMSSYRMVQSGYKRSLNLSVDMVDEDQKLLGYSTLNLLNAHEDDSMLGSVLYSHIARQYIPAPKANLVRVVINGESWGLYANVQQFNKTFLKENFTSSKGARWKVSGSPMGSSGLAYVGDDVEAYKQKYDMKSGDDKDWTALVELCRIIDQTPADQLEGELRKVMNVDGLLWFLALDNALINCDGYWIRASDYSIYRDGDGKFHVLPHDMNEAFRRPMGPGMGGPRMGGGPGGFPGFGGPGAGGPPPEGAPPADVLAGGPPPGGPGGPGGPPPGFGGPGGPGGFGPGGGFGRSSIGPVDGVKLDPLVGMDDTGKPLRSKVLAVPALRAQYIANVKTIASKSLDWNSLGTIVSNYRSLMDAEVKADTRKLGSYEAFLKATANEVSNDHEVDEPAPGPFGHNRMSLRQFVDDRRDYLMSYSEPAAKE